MIQLSRKYTLEENDYETNEKLNLILSDSAYDIYTLIGIRVSSEAVYHFQRKCRAPYKTVYRRYSNNSSTFGAAWNANIIKMTKL